MKSQTLSLRHQLGRCLVPMLVLRICRCQVFLCLWLISLSSLVGPNSKAFANACGVAKGSKVQVIKTGTSGLRVRECAGTSCAQVGGKFDWGTGTPLNQVVPNSAVSVSGTDFSATLTQLSPGMRYNFRAWAKNGSTASLAGISPGWSYGDILTFETTTPCSYTIQPANRSHRASTENNTLSVSCSYSISPASRTHGAGAEENGFNAVTADGCAWTANTSDAWITVKTANGSGNGTVSYSVSANPGTTERKGTITIQGQSFSITQSAKTTIF